MTEPDYLIEGVPCCAGCFCNHDAQEIARWEKVFSEHAELAARLQAEKDEIAVRADAERVAALHEHLARFRR